MSSRMLADPDVQPRYAGLRLSADDFFELDDDGFRYELIDGVMVMSPSPKPSHQRTLVELITEVSIFLRQHHVGEAFPDIDVKFDEDLVYRPDLVFIRQERLRKPLDRIDVVPDLIVEIISTSSRLLDSGDKKQDYERYGVTEYWLIDPLEEQVTFFRRSGDKLVEVAPDADRFLSTAIPGFALDTAALRRAFRAI